MDVSTRSPPRHACAGRAGRQRPPGLEFLVDAPGPGVAGALVLPLSISLRPLRRRPRQSPPHGSSSGIRGDGAWRCSTDLLVEHRHPPVRVPDRALQLHPRLRHHPRFSRCNTGRRHRRRVALHVGAHDGSVRFAVGVGPAAHRAVPATRARDRFGNVDGRVWRGVRPHRLHRLLLRRLRRADRAVDHRRTILRRTNPVRTSVADVTHAPCPRHVSGAPRDWSAS